MKIYFQFLLFLFTSFGARAQYNSLLWKISGNGLKQPSYLYGTMHTKDARVFAFGDSVIPFFSSAKAYAMELDPKDAFNLGLISKVMMGKGNSLKKMIPRREYFLLDSLVKEEMGFSVSMFDNVAPVFTMSILEMRSAGLSDSSIKGNKEVLDMYFYKLAKNPPSGRKWKKKKIIGIETVDEQLGALNVLSYQEQADLLVQEIHSMTQQDEGATDVVKFYLEQNLDSLASSEDVAQMPEKFYKAIVSDRNERMAERIAGFIFDQSTFIAVGALHLPKETGVIALLRKKGFVVEAVIRQ